MVNFSITNLSPKNDCLFIQINNIFETFNYKKKKKRKYYFLYKIYARIN